MKARAEIETKNTGVKGVNTINNNKKNTNRKRQGRRERLVNVPLIYFYLASLLKGKSPHVVACRKVAIGEKVNSA